MRTKLWRESMRGADHSEDLSTDGRILLKWILSKSRLRGVDWNHVSRDDRWLAVVYTVMNLRVQQNTGIFLSS